MAGNGVGFYILNEFQIQIDSAIVGLDSLGVTPVPNDTGIYLDLTYNLFI